MSSLALDLSLGLSRRGGSQWWNTLHKTDSGVSPVLALDFASVAGGQYMADSVSKTFDDLITFTRASTATHRDNTGTIVTAASGAKRLDHDKDGNRIGLLVEEARTNDGLWSDDWTNAAYDTVTSITAAKDQTGADGVANSASSLLAGAANSIITQSITAVAATRVYSVHIKRIIGTGNIELTQDGGTTWLDIKASIDSTDYIQVETASASVTNPVVGIRIVTSGDKIAVQYGDAEVGTFATSPKPTTTVAVTRAAETATAAAAGWTHNASEGSWYAEYISPQDVSAGVTSAVLFDRTDGANRHWHAIVNGKFHSAHQEVGVIFGDMLSGSVAANTNYKWADRYALNDFSQHVDGVEIGTDITGTPSLTFDGLQIGQEAGAVHFNSHIKAIVFYTTGLSDADLVGLTT